MGSIIAIGEILLEFFPKPLHAPLDTATDFKPCAGGAPLTFAATAQRLGCAAELIAVVGTDPFSHLLVDGMKSEGLSTDLLRQVADRQIGLVFHDNSDEDTRLIFYRNDSAGSLLGPEDVTEDSIKKAALVYFPGVALQVSHATQEACMKAARLAGASGVPLAVDPNIRAIQGGLQSRRVLEGAISMADIITPNQAEAIALTRESNPHKAGRRLLEMGPKTVAVTMEREGCLLFHQGEEVYAPGYAVDVIEPTGAGDAFAAALCVGLLQGWPAEQIAHYANAAGALAVTAIGHLGPALPTPEKIGALLAGGRAGDTWGDWVKTFKHASTTSGSYSTPLCCEISSKALSIPKAGR